MFLMVHIAGGEVLLGGVIHALSERWTICVANDGQYFEYVIFDTFVCNRAFDLIKNNTYSMLQIWYKLYPQPKRWPRFLDDHNAPTN